MTRDLWQLMPTPTMTDADVFMVAATAMLPSLTPCQRIVAWLFKIKI